MGAMTAQRNDKRKRNRERGRLKAPDALSMQSGESAVNTIESIKLGKEYRAEARMISANCLSYSDPLPSGSAIKSCDD